MAETNNYKILLVDDEPEARSLLKSLLNEIRYVEVIGEADCAEEAMYKLIEFYPDAVFMDISMPGKTGMEFIELVKKRNIDVQVVFISAHKEYAVQSIRNEVYDFLLKPVNRQELKEKVEKLRRKNEKGLSRRFQDIFDNIKENAKIRINSRYSYVLIDPSEIIYCQSGGGYTNIYMMNGKEEVASATLSQIETMVEGWNFYKLSRSVLINQNYIRQVDKGRNVCILRANSHDWTIKVSHKRIVGLLSTCFNYA